MLVKFTILDNSDSQVFKEDQKFTATSYLEILEPKVSVKVIETFHFPTKEEAEEKLKEMKTNFWK